jgi:hypothetical protein
LLRELTPAKIDEFANRHDLAPTHPEPWKKILVGGSDDHGGKFFASAFTETPKAKTPAEFLAHIRAGRCQSKGRAGTPLALSHGFYNTLSSFYSGSLSRKAGTGRDIARANVFAFHGGARSDAIHSP